MTYAIHMFHGYLFSALCSRFGGDHGSFVIGASQALADMRIERNFLRQHKPSSYGKKKK